MAPPQKGGLPSFFLGSVFEDTDPQGGSISASTERRVTLLFSLTEGSLLWVAPLAARMRRFSPYAGTGTGTRLPCPHAARTALQRRRPRGGPGPARKKRARP
jgi:hypothetical protein